MDILLPTLRQNGGGKPYKVINGVRSGKLVVIEPVIRDNKRRYVRCKCDCGNEIEVQKQAIIGKHKTQSCGCTKQHRYAKPWGEAAFSVLYYTYKRNAKTAGREFQLSEDQFRQLTSSACAYCGEKPSRIFNNGGLLCNGPYIYNGIDRVDNTKGYTIDNCASCCKACNLAKRTMSVDEFAAWIQRVYTFFVRPKGDSID